MSDTIKQAIVEYLSKAKPEGEPLKNIDKALKTRKLIAKDESAAALLDAMAKDAMLHVHPAATAAGGPLYSRLSVAQYLGDKVHALIAGAKKPLTSAQIKTKLKRYGDHVDAALAALLAQGKACWFKVGKKSLLYAHKPRPTAALSAAELKTLKKLLDAINKNRVKPISPDALLAFLDAEGAGAAPKVVTTQELIPLLKQWYREDIHLMRGSRALPIPYTWKRYEQWARERGMEPDAAIFREALWAMQKAEEIGLVHHDKPSEIPSEERICLPVTSEGFTIYFWSLYEK